jgi:PAS domain S-box-containing protein
MKTLNDHPRRTIPASANRSSGRAIDPLFPRLLECLGDWIWLVDTTGVVIYSNQRVKDLLGYDPMEVMGAPVYRFMPADHCRQLQKILKDRVLPASAEARCLPLIFTSKSGGLVFIEASLCPMAGHDGRLLGWTGVGRDISRRNQSDEMQRYKALFDHVADSVIIFNRRGQVLECNEGLVQQSGYSRQELLAMEMEDLIDGRQMAQVRAFVESLWRNRTMRGELDIVRKDGSLLPFEISARLIRFAGQACVLCMGRDITETKHMQDRLIRSERLAATGQLAASIAHEINSPLQGVSALLNVIRKDCLENSDLITNIDLIKGAFESIRDTVRHLLDLNRPARGVKQPVDLNRIIEDTLALMRGHLRKNKVDVDFDLAPDLPRIIASAQQLGQVFLNLFNNAVEAMTGVSSRDTGLQQRSFFGGKITVRSRLEPKQIQVQIADNGPGILEGDLRHIFDPFYTRKKAMGMGIGLSICHGIIEEHHGTISAENGENAGAIFTITLPLEER